MISLYPDQSELVNELRVAMGSYKSVLLQSATGSGKTQIAKYLIWCAKNKDNTIIFTVPRRDLMEQSSESFSLHGISHSFIAAGKPFNPFAKVYIGMVDTMARRMDKLPAAKLIIIDETHFGADSLDKIIKYYREMGAWIVGLSATPMKLSGQGMDRWYQNMVCGKSVRWLIDNKRLSDYRYFYGRTKPDLSKIGMTAGDYNKGELGHFMEEQKVIIGDCVNDYIKNAMGRLHIVRCSSIKHSQMTAQSFRDAGILFMHVDGNTPSDERKRIFKSYARRELLGLTFCDLLNLGFDLSQASGMDVCVESASDLKPTKSLTSQMQFWGRALRYKPYPAIFHDHVNNFTEHGLPCSDREWSLEGRKQGKKNTEKVPPTKTCDGCFFVHSPAPSCPSCGKIYSVQSRDIDQVDGELRELTPADIKKQSAVATKKIANELLYGEGKEHLSKNDENSLNFLINKFTKDGVKNPAAKAAHVLAASMAKKKKG